MDSSTNAFPTALKKFRRKLSNDYVLVAKAATTSKII